MINILITDRRGKDTDTEENALWSWSRDWTDLATSQGMSGATGSRDKEQILHQGPRGSAALLTP